MNRTFKFALISLFFNTAFAAYHITLGAITRSLWLFTVGTYYVILSTARFITVRSKKSGKKIARTIGILLTVLSLPLIGTVILSAVEDRGTEFHKIVMIAIATYSFTKISVATVNLIKSRKSSSAKLITLRNISFSDALVSIFSLQRSMLVSFAGMKSDGIVIMNVMTGIAVSVLVFLSGLNLVRRKTAVWRFDG